MAQGYSKITKGFRVPCERQSARSGEIEVVSRECSRPLNRRAIFYCPKEKISGYGLILREVL